MTKKTNIKKIGISLALGLSLFASGLSNVYAYSGDDAYDVNRIETWVQWKYPEAHNTILKEGGSTVADASCGYFAYTAALRKEGSVGPTYDPMDFIYNVYSTGLTDSSWGHVNFKNIDSLNLPLTIAKGNEYYSAKNDGTSYGWTVYGTAQEKYDTIVNLMNDGYYVMACVNSPRTDGHYVLFDYIDNEGRLRIFDSGYPATYFDEEYNYGNLMYILIFESANGNPSNTRPSIYNFDESSIAYNAEIEQINNQRQAEEEHQAKMDELARLRAEELEAEEEDRWRNYVRSNTGIRKIIDYYKSPVFFEMSLN